MWTRSTARTPHRPPRRRGPHRQLTRRRAPRSPRGPSKAALPLRQDYRPLAAIRPRRPRTVTVFCLALLYPANRPKLVICVSSSIHLFDLSLTDLQ